MAIENRVVFGILDEEKQIHGESGQDPISRGFIKIVLEMTDGYVSKINEKVYFDSPPKIYYKDKSFDKILRKTQKRLIKIDGIVSNENYFEGGNQSRYVAFDKHISELGSHDFYSIIEAPLNDSLNLNIRLPHPPRTKYFFTLDGDYFYGPFKIEQDAKTKDSGDDDLLCQGELVPAAGKIDGFPELRPSNIFKISLSEFKSYGESSYVEGGECIYITNTSSIQKIKKEIISFTTKRDVINYLSSLAESRIINKTVVAAVLKNLNSPKIPFSHESKEIIKRIVVEASEKDEWTRLLVETMNQDIHGKEIINKHIDSIKERYVDEWDSIAKQKHSALTVKIEESRKELDALSESLNLSRKELEDKKLELSQIIEEIESGDHEDRLAIKKQEMDKEISEKNRVLEELTKKYSMYNGLEDIENRVKNEKKTYEVFIEQNKQLKTTQEDLKRKVENVDGELQKKLRELIPYVSSIIQAPIPTREDYPQFEKQARVNLSLETKAEVEICANTIVNVTAFKFYELHGRSYSNSFISSVLVACFQSFLTVFTGPPGLGKTSFLRIIKDIYNLENRFLEISVGRNWVSERDLIGFYNSLTGSFSPSSTGFYGFLKGIEKDDLENCAPHFVLLDEANLSPLEHYGASLLNKADTEADRKVRLPNSELYLPPSLRILATINHDMTTEPLSPRLLDRAPVIPFDVFQNEMPDYLDVEEEVIFTFKTFEQIFGRHSKIKLKEESSSDVLIILKSIIYVLSDSDVDYGIPFIVSKRKQKSLIDYISVLAPILSSNGKISLQDAVAVATDYAVLYFILPPLNGNGVHVGNRLKALNDKLRSYSLNKAADKLSDMIARGEHNLDSFNFFNY